MSEVIVPICPADDVEGIRGCGSGNVVQTHDRFYDCLSCGMYFTLGASARWQEGAGPAALAAWTAGHARQLLRGGNPYAIAGWPTVGVNPGNSFTRREVRAHQLSYEEMPADEFSPVPWVRVRCSGCPEWGLSLETGHSEDDYRRLEAMHAGAVR